MSSPVHVAVGVILNSQRQVLVALRHQDSHQGGLWEFPGGKLETGESVCAALKRELHEELGISIGAHHPLKKIQHCYADKTVLLDVWLVREFSGEPRGREGQEIRWSNPVELDKNEFPAANASIIDCLQLPSQMAITPDVTTENELLVLLEGYRRQKLAMIQLRQTQCDEVGLLKLAELAAEFCAAECPQIKLLVNARAQLHTRNSRKIELGLHVNSAQLMRLQKRPSAAGTLLSASCHNLEQLRQAEKLEVDLALLSAVLPTHSHPTAPALGWHQFEQLAASVSIPVYALGGVGPGELEQAFACGAHGVAGISAYTQTLSKI